MSVNLPNDIRSKLLEVVRLMNAATEQGIKIEFNITPGPDGKQMLHFKAWNELKLD